jgi:DNA-binding NtrC family response regulator
LNFINEWWAEDKTVCCEVAIEKIVVVDDELMIRKALETQLRNKRYSVASTGDLKGARKILARDSFDLVFLDLRLPDGEGTDLLEEITALKRMVLWLS